MQMKRLRLQQVNAFPKAVQEGRGPPGIGPGHPAHHPRASACLPAHANPAAGLPARYVDMSPETVPLRPHGEKERHCCVAPPGDAGGAEVPVLSQPLQARPHAGPLGRWSLLFQGRG